MEITNIGKNIFTGTGEGPHYDARLDELYLIEIPDKGKREHGRLFRKKYSDLNAEFEVLDMGEVYTTFIIPTKEEKLLVGLNQSIIEVDWPRYGESASHKTIVSVEEGKQTRFNDAKCDPRGRLVAGTMSLEKSPGIVFEPEAGGLYGINTDRSLKILDDKYTLSNGLAWSSDEKQMFFIDSVMSKVFVYDYDPVNFTASNRRVLYDFKAKGEIGLPDGCCIDTNNRLWVALYNGASIICIDTTTGEKCNTVNFPAQRITSLCFGGPNHDEMIVTSSNTGAVVTDTEAGSLYVVRNSGVKGFPMVRFDG